MLKYSKETAKLIKRYNNLKDKVVERKKEFKDLCDFIENKTEWLTAPASTRFHLSKKYGLLEHSCNVAETMLKIKGVLSPETPDESCVIVALLHDLGKAGMPGNPQYIVSEPSERQKRAGYPAWAPYRFNNDLTYLSIPVRSLYLALPYLPLSEDEAQAIAYHDGQYVDDNRSVAKHEVPLTLLLQYSDNWCGFVLEA
ncbi:MAG: phosphohydrolase [Clostridiales bacterium]|nr:phosphohydrolase [Clostridiales bacterium]